MSRHFQLIEHKGRTGVLKADRRRTAWASAYKLWLRRREQYQQAIQGYSYEVWRGSEELYWYDSQPHPNDPTLAGSEPHHKHIPPDIEHHRLNHRLSAPCLGFDKPNLPFLMEEIEKLFFRN